MPPAVTRTFRLTTSALVLPDASLTRSRTSIWMDVVLPVGNCDVKKPHPEKVGENKPFVLEPVCDCEPTM